MNEINVSKIIGAYPIGTQVYSPAYGYCVFKGLAENGLVNLKAILSGEEITLTEDDIIAEGGELMVYPSRYMRDWSKLSWKKGDVLVSNDGGTEVIFDKWYDDTYTSFYGKHCLDSENENNIKYFEGFVCTTERYFIESKDAAQTYINTIEERLGGKLNLETLVVEQPKQYFKDGDIVTWELLDGSLVIVLVKRIGIEGEIYFHAYMLDGNVRTQRTEKDFYGYVMDAKIATDSEKQQLFDALAKKNKAWDAEKKQIVDLKPKYEFKPFDRCIWKIRNCEGSIWQASFVSYVDEHGATPMGISIDEDLVNLTILPYNDQTKLLVGTTDELKGGEG